MVDFVRQSERQGGGKVTGSATRDVDGGEERGAEHEQEHSAFCNALSPNTTSNVKTTNRASAPVALNTHKLAASAPVEKMQLLQI